MLVSSTTTVFCLAFLCKKIMRNFNSRKLNYDFCEWKPPTWSTRLSCPQTIDFKAKIQRRQESLCRDAKVFEGGRNRDATLSCFRIKPSKYKTKWGKCFVPLRWRCPQLAVQLSLIGYSLFSWQNAHLVDRRRCCGRLWQ